MNENNTNYTTPFDAGQYDYLFDKTLTDKIISLWLNGYSPERIANRLDCTIDYVNQTVDREIYYLTEN